MIDSIAPILVTLCVNWLLVLGLKSLHIFKTKPMCPFQFGYICVWQITPHFAAIQCVGDDHIFIDGSRGQGIQVFEMSLLHILRKVPRSLRHASCMRRCVDKYLSHVIPRWVYWSTISICCWSIWNECSEWPLSGLLHITTAHWQRYTQIAIS